MGPIIFTSNSNNVSVPTSFPSAVQAVLGASASTRCYSPAQLLTQWEQLVDWCKQGYRWDVSEYGNELSVREKLERLLTSEQLQPYRELQELRTRVSEIDAQFKALL